MVTCQMRVIACIGWLLSMAALTGCTAWRGIIAEHTYPRDFEYIEPEQVRSSMAKLARGVQALNRIFVHGDPTIDQREAVVAILGEMQTVAAELDPSGQRTNHPLIDKNVAAFRRNLALAREGAERTPPNYFLAGSISGECSSCHRSER